MNKPQVDSQSAASPGAQPAPSKPLTLANAHWQVEFTRRGDRLVHVISRVVEGTRQPILESLEGTSDDVWPASPPLQEIHFESRPGVQLALPVGMAGKSHWSISIELCADSGRLLFDVACRMRSAADFLGSSYVVVDQTAGNPQWALTAEAIDEQPAATVERTPGRIAIRPVVLPTVFPATVRWRYTLRVSK